MHIDQIQLQRNDFDPRDKNTETSTSNFDDQQKSPKVQNFRNDQVTRRQLELLSESKLSSDTELARGLLTHALQADSSNPLFIDLVPKVFSLEKRDGLKIQAHLERSPDLNHRVKHAHFLFESKRFLSAKEKYFELLTELMDLHPSHIEIYKNLGNIFCYEGDFDAAEEYFLKALTLEPHSVVIRCNLGFLELQRKNFVQAEQFFRLALERDSTSDKAWAGLGLVHQSQENLDMARASFLQALERNSSNRVALQALGNTAASTGQFQGIVECFTKYLRDHPFDHEIRSAFIYLLELQDDESSAELEKMQLEILREDWI